jgi:hypothetical protein
MNLFCFTDPQIFEQYHNQKLSLDDVADYTDIVPICFSSCNKEKDNNPYSDWDLDNEIVMSMKDFDLLLKEHVFNLFPITDPDTGDKVNEFDYTTFNEFSKTDCLSLMGMIKQDALPKADEKTHAFYSKFLTWLENALKTASVIVIDGAL